MNLVILFTPLPTSPVEGEEQNFPPRAVSVSASRPELEPTPRRRGIEGGGYNRPFFCFGLIDSKILKRAAYDQQHILLKG